MHDLGDEPMPSEAKLKTKTDWEELFRSDNGLDQPTAEKQADWIMEQMLEGTFVGDGSRITVRNYLVMHLQAAEERGKRKATQC
jgi:hypothetical protein